jgi:DNA-binding NarL/FixJ family response regulator
VPSQDSLSLEKDMNVFATRRLNILVMHQDPLLCAGVVAALRQQAPFEVFTEGELAPPTVQSKPIDVVIVDYLTALRLGGAERAANGFATARIVVLTADDGEADIRRAIEAGIDGYLLLGGTVGELIEGVATVARGARYFCRAVAQRMVDSLTHASLTPRENEVLELVVLGESNKSIARRLRIELRTVKTHVSSIMSKLGAASRTEAAGIAVKRGLVDKRSPRTPVPSDVRPEFMDLLTPSLVSIRRSHVESHASDRQ